jgi:hypothetical protein
MSLTDVGQLEMRLCEGDETDDQKIFSGLFPKCSSLSLTLATKILALEYKDSSMDCILLVHAVVLAVEMRKALPR